MNKYRTHNCSELNEKEILLPKNRFNKGGSRAKPNTKQIYKHE